MKKFNRALIWFIPISGIYVYFIILGLYILKLNFVDLKDYLLNPRTWHYSFTNYYYGLAYLLIPFVIIITAITFIFIIYKFSFRNVKKINKKKLAIYTIILVLVSFILIIALSGTERWILENKFILGIINKERIQNK